MIHHLTYSTPNMSKSAEKCVSSALRFGCDFSEYYKPEDIDATFVKDNFDILIESRGAGYWLWKPYFILKEFNACEYGDYVVYTDAGVQFVGNVNELIKEMDSDIMVFGNGWRHGDWCKQDVINEMNAHLYVDHDQCQASCVIFRVCQYSFDFVDEWLGWCTRPGMIDDSPSKAPNCETFREHRHDQAILTNLAIKEGLTFNRWPAQYALKGNEKYKNKYGVIFNHHGLRNNGKRTNE